MVWVSGVQSPSWRLSFPFKSKEKVLIKTLQKKDVVVKVAFFFCFSLKNFRLLCLKEKPVSGPALSPEDFFSLKHRDDFIHVPPFILLPSWVPVIKSVVLMLCGPECCQI